MNGLFITFEGVEGSGKSTQIDRLAERLREKGYTVDVTREPGGTPTAEAIRALVLDPAHSALLPRAELMLYEAARAQHMEERILPRLNDGAVVLCDRFTDSTAAYQGAGRGLAPETIDTLNRVATADRQPDLTILIDLSAEVGLARATRAATDRIESESLAFHERVREGFLAIAKANPERVTVVDGNGTEEAIAEAIAAIVERFLEGRR